MLSLIKNKLSRFVLLSLSKRKFQNIWLRLLHLSYYGMNIKNDGKIYSSGEIFVLKYIKNRYDGELNTDSFVLFDVGANKGLYAEAVLQVFQNKNIKIFCFEPSSTIYNTLLSKFENEKNIILNKLGFGDYKEERIIYLSQIDSGSSSLHDFSQTHNNLGAPIKESVLLDTLDNYLSLNNIKRVHLLKIDIEGHEYYTLKGAQNAIDNRLIDFIQFEFGSHCINSRIFFKDLYFLLINQYKIYRILPNGFFEIKKYSTDLEIFATTNFLAVSRSLNI